MWRLDGNRRFINSIVHSEYVKRYTSEAFRYRRICTSVVRRYGDAVSGERARQTRKVRRGFNSGALTELVGEGSPIGYSILSKPKTPGLYFLRIGFIGLKPPTSANQ